MEEKKEATVWVGSPKSNVIFLLSVVFTTVIVLDQVSKWLFFKPEFLPLNYGISLGLGQAFSPVALSSMLFLVLFTLFLWQRVYFFHHPVASGLFFGGAVSNLVERAAIGGVRDWFLIPGLQLYNNFADWFLILGWLFFVYGVLKKKHNV